MYATFAVHPCCPDFLAFVILSVFSYAEPEVRIKFDRRIDVIAEAIEVINDCYKKMLMIGKSKEVFRLPNNKIPHLLSAKTYSEFTLAKDNIERRYKRYLKLGGVKLNIKIPTELVPNPKNYTKKTSLPTQRSVLVREEILHHEYHMKNLNVLKCEICLELHIVDGQVQQTRKPYSCQKCHNRKDPM